MSRSRAAEVACRNLKLKPESTSGNIAYNARATDIRRMLEPFGEIAAAHVFTAGNKRFAFVLMMNESDAESAIEE